ncbi:MAG: cation transporter [Lachnospiraceae bacterium]|nr:cation transporter [Lachnospiraceae bacterium]
MEKEILYKQQKIALVFILWRFPSVLSSLLAACASGSMVVWTELIESMSEFFPVLIIGILSYKMRNDLRFKFNYGTGKIEAITALSCEMFEIAGLICVLFFSVRRIIYPSFKDKYMEFALIVSVIGLIIDIFGMMNEKKLLENASSKLIHTAYFGASKEFIFDIMAIISLIVSIVCDDRSWIKYFSPVMSIILVIPFLFILLRHVRESVSELIDHTLDEETQMEILKVMTDHYGKYEKLGEIRSRVNGTLKEIEIELGFDENMSFHEIKEVSELICSDIQSRLEGSRVRITLSL